MPESSCLHIQGRESGPIRVVELPWISVRIGRAAYCEVQLAEYHLADEACRLQRRGQSWHLVPVATRSLVLLEGRPVDGACQLPFDVPFYIGAYCLTLRRDRAAEPDWEMYQAPALPQLNHSAPTLEARFPALADPDRATIGIGTGPMTEPEDPPAAIADRTELKRERPLQGPGVKDRWEARWRAAGAELKARSQPKRTAGEPKHPDYGTRFDSVPLKEPRIPRARPAAPPKLDPSIRPVPAPATPQVEATRPGRDLEPTSHSFEESDFENRLQLALSDALDDEPGPSLVAEPALDAPTDADEPVVDTVHGQEDEKHEELAEGDHETDLTAAEPELAGPLPDVLEMPEVIESDREMSPVIDRAVERDDTSLEVASQVETREFEGSGGDRTTHFSRSAAAVEHEPNDNRPDSKKSEGTASGARLVGKAPMREKPRSSRREISDHQRTEANRGASSRARLGADRRGLDSGSLGSGPSHDHVEWPSAQDILATHRARPNPPAPPRTSVKASQWTATQTSPTLACEPNQWTLPFWLAWPPLAAFVVCVGVVGCTLSWSWACDSYSAAIVTNRLILADISARRTPLPDTVAPPRGTWMETSAQHLAHWAIYLNRFERPKDDSPRGIRELLDRALQVSPLNPTARLALAQLEPPASQTMASIRGLGLSRDPLSLAWSGRRLLDAGKKEAALNLYKQALEVASRGEFSQVTAPRFNDDQGVPRYLLPGEERIRDIVRELVARNEWTAGEWLEVLPRQTLALLATARLLREQARNDVADTLLDPILNQPTDGPIEPLELAIRAEAFALRSRCEDAYRQYHEAIELLDDDTLKRSWWFNLADIAFRLADDAKRQAALRATLTTAASDDISRRATEILRATNTRPSMRSNRVKAN
jgi:tetratricopeptide (TPR) repeat protein